MNCRIGRRQPEHKIELLLRVEQQAEPDHAAEHGLALEDTWTEPDAMI